MELKQHIFYQVNNLSLEQKQNILLDAKKVCYDWKVDKLDCSESWQRKQIEMSFEEVIKKFKSNCHFFVINRKQRYLEKEHGEIGFRAMDIIDYFLWIRLEMNNFNKLIKKHKLKEWV